MKLTVILKLLWHPFVWKQTDFENTKWFLNYTWKCMNKWMVTFPQVFMFSASLFQCIRRTICFGNEILTQFSPSDCLPLHIIFFRFLVMGLGKSRLKRNCQENRDCVHWNRYYVRYFGVILVECSCYRLGW